MSAIHSRLTVLRAERHLSQRKLADLAGLRPATVSALERDETQGIQFETLARLCAALGCEPGEILALEHEAHTVPMLGGPDEDEILRERLREAGPRVDGPSFLAALAELAAEESA